jgi:hypothetical protein
MGTVALDQTSHDTFPLTFYPKVSRFVRMSRKTKLHMMLLLDTRPRSIEMREVFEYRDAVVLDSFGPKCRERHVDTFLILLLKLSGRGNFVLQLS